MREKLKGFFKKNLDEKTQDTNIKSNTFIKKDTITYEEWGYEQAGKQNGNLNAFNGNLNLVKEDFIKGEHSDSGKIEEEKRNAKAEYEHIITENENKESQIERFTSKIENLKNKIENLKREVINIQENPSKILKDKTSKVGFYIGLVILLFLTIYLFIFYSSASYSGFFKKFEEDANVGNSIFDPHALSKAFNDGATEVILILTIPFIFLGLGYLIHKFQEGKGIAKYFRIALMMLITFSFDGLLAYKIEKGLYEVERLNDPTGAMPPHQVSMAFSSENFWLVIFAGFIVYIIWGFVFDFVMDSYDKLDEVAQAIRAKQQEIEIHNIEIKKAEENIEKTKAEIEDNKLKCAKLKKIIDGSTIIIDWTAFEKVLLEFVNGWSRWVKENLNASYIDKTWEAHKNYIDAHKQEKNQKKIEQQKENKL